MSNELRDKALKYLWMQNRDWSQMAEIGDPPVFVKGEGIRVTDTEGNTYIDVNAGYNSVNVGYGRSEIAEEIYKQMLEVNYFPEGSTTKPTIELAKKLSDLTPGDLSRVFPVSGGSEANETALKIARAYHVKNGDINRNKIISRRGSYHGTTAGVLWLGGGPPVASRDDFEPMYPNMLHAPQPNSYRCEFNSLNNSECAIKSANAIEDLIKFHGPNTIAAAIAEPIAIPQGAIVPGDEYWPMLREICDKYGVLLIADEVICGFGRTGKMFAIEHWGITPDIMTVAKGIISSYLPLAATIVSKKVADKFADENNYFKHTLTNSGHPVSAAAALKNIEILENENIIDNSAKMGKYLKEQLEVLKTDHQIIGDVRGIGLLVAFEIVSDRKTKSLFSSDLSIPDRLTEKFFKHGLIFRVSNEILNIGPPLSITRSEIDEIVHAIDLSLWELEGELGLPVND